MAKLYIRSLQIIVNDFEGKPRNSESSFADLVNKIGGLLSAFSIGNLKKFFVFSVFKPCFVKKKKGKNTTMKRSNRKVLNDIVKTSRRIFKKFGGFF